MRKNYIVYIMLFFILLLLPVVFFNNKENVTSEIDNRNLTNNPLKDESVVKEFGSLTGAIENYTSDRIGFRNFFIRSYTYLNDILFNKMIHPSYEYGQDGYVFFNRQTGDKLDSDDFYDDLLNMIIQINDYCKKRNIPFIFVFEPSKSSVMKDKINKGIDYDNSWLNDLFKVILDNDIAFANNYDLLKEKYENGEDVFNKKYDAGHWNDLGAFYGVNNILEQIKKYYRNIHVNTLDDFNMKTIKYDTLPVSEYSIDEVGTEYKIKELQSKNLTDLYSNEVNRNKRYNYFSYWKNDKIKNTAPKTLVFQGSYMNSKGYKFLLNNLYEYIAVHNYNNILDFEYYYNLFQPDCVVFEVTEYTLSGHYFNKEKLKQFSLNPNYDSFKKYHTETKKLNKNQLVVNKLEKTVTITVRDLPNSFDYAYLLINNKVYDLIKSSDGNYGVTVSIENYRDNMNVSIVNVDNKKIVNYKK